MEHEEIGLLTERRQHRGERLVGMAVHGREGATQERIPDVECNEQNLSHERLVIPHRMLRGRRGHEGWGPGGVQACRTLLAAERASELKLPSPVRQDRGGRVRGGWRRRALAEAR